MKKPVLFLCFAGLSLGGFAQLKTTVTCPVFTINILDGRVNDVLLPSSTADYIKKQLPCFTSADAESSTAKCGGGVFFKDKDLYFYTGRDYVEIGPKFKGKLSLPLMGASRGGMFKWLGNPKIKDVSWDAFTTSYGTLILYYNKANKVVKIQFSSLTTEVLNLCE